jgi:hypothetical protein
VIPAEVARGLQVRLNAFEVERPRPWGACWLALWLWELLALDAFWSQRLPPSRAGTRWPLLLAALTAYRLIEPGSEWRLHRHWFGTTALGDLLGPDFSLGGKDNLYRCLDRLLAHKDDLFLHLRRRWQDLDPALLEIELHALLEAVGTDARTDLQRYHGAVDPQRGVGRLGVRLRTVAGRHGPH